MRLPIFLDAEESNGKFSFWFGEPVLYVGLFLSMIPPAIGIFVGDGVRGDELNFSPRIGKGDEGELPLRVACAIKDFKSERELRRFFLSDFTASFSSCGEAQIVLSLFAGPWELEGRSSKAPSTVGLSRDTGRLLGDSIDRERFKETFERLDEVMGSPVATLRLLLLRVRHTEGRSSLLLFCLSNVSANLFLKDDAFDVNEPVAE